MIIMPDEDDRDEIKRYSGYEPREYVATIARLEELYAANLAEDLKWLEEDGFFESLEPTKTVRKEDK